MRLSTRLKMLHESGDVGDVLEGKSDVARKMENLILELLYCKYYFIGNSEQKSHKLAIEKLEELCQD